MEKTKAQKLKGVYYIDPPDMEFKDTMLKKDGMTAGIRYDLLREIQTLGGQDSHVLSTPTNARDRALERFEHKDHEDLVAERGSTR